MHIHLLLPVPSQLLLLSGPLCRLWTGNLSQRLFMHTGGVNHQQGEGRLDSLLCSTLGAGAVHHSSVQVCDHG